MPLRCGHRWSPGKFSLPQSADEYAFHRVSDGDPFTNQRITLAFSVCTSRVIFGVLPSRTSRADRSADYQNDDRAKKDAVLRRFTNHRVWRALTLTQFVKQGN